MKIIVGLGNPGLRYKKTRHNAGFLVLENFAKRKECDFTNFNNSKKLRSDIAKGRCENENFFLVKPTTYMNNSGQAVSAVLDYHKNDAKVKDLIIIHDDIDLELGQIKISKGSGSAGHRGVESIINHVKSKDFIRIRVGISSSKRKETDKYVLGRFTRKELAVMKEDYDTIYECLKLLITKDLNTAKNYLGKQKNL